jgi:hypothetical protein
MKHLSPILFPRLGDLGRVGMWDVPDTEDDRLFGSWEFCQSLLEDYFEIPDMATQIQFEARSERFPGSMKVDIGHPCILEDQERVNLLAFTLVDIKELLGTRRRTWYVKLYYWE